MLNSPWKPKNPPLPSRFARYFLLILYPIITIRINQLKRLFPLPSPPLPHLIYLAPSQYHLHASSTNVDIKLDDFGLERIEVCDNGKGVKKSDVPFMTKRHYTSKLSGMESFLTLETYGFRGEALGK
ncbi:hypothetical protein RRG08_004848 [Elysia crispata]|uniref:Uncharacterized protein n=1 Tax=Elysia crispata TaxID=231223 RepID=A0AAE0ZSJ5_9GAST|nr:hypothetical protein RRG08_004848 [Elysia crispata]